MKIKKQNIIIGLTLFILTSCVKDEDRVFEGFSFYITSNVGSFEDSEIVIGGMQNGTFVPTDSIKFDKIEYLSRHYYFDDNRWKPNLDKIRAIPSGRCYFKIKLSDQREEMIMNNSSLMSLLLPKENFFKGRYGQLQLNIEVDKVFGGADEEL